MGPTVKVMRKNVGWWINSAIMCLGLGLEWRQGVAKSVAR